MRGEENISNMWRKPVREKGRGAGNKTVQYHGQTKCCGGENDAGYGANFEAANLRKHVQRIVGIRSVDPKAILDGSNFSRQSLVIDAGAATDNICRREW